MMLCVQVVEETVAESETQAVTGMMQLQQGGHSHRAVLAAVQGLQQPLPRHQLLQQPAARAPAVTGSAANRLIGEVVQSRRRPLLGPSPG